LQQNFAELLNIVAFIENIPLEVIAKDLVAVVVEET